MKITLRVNGVGHTLDVDPTRRLLDLLRYDVGLTGTKEGCGEGECGACSVRLNGRVVNSCLVAAAQADGGEVETVEGVSSKPRGKILVDSFATMHSSQCGFCTPGFFVAADALLEENSDPDEREIRTALAGNICRCTGYDMIVDGVQLAARRLRDGETSAPHGAPAAATPAVGGSGSAGATPAIRDAADASSARRPDAPRSIKTIGDAANLALHPDTLSEALRFRAQHDCVVIAGGTDVMVRRRGYNEAGPRIEKPVLFVDGIKEISTITRRDDALVIGGAVPLTDLERDERVPVLLRRAITELAAWGLRNRATLAGNICNASPAADSLPPLYVLDARVTLTSTSGSREIPIGEFVTGPGATLLAADELLTAVTIPVDGSATTSAGYDSTGGSVGDNGHATEPTGRVDATEARRVDYYRKVGTRRANALSKLSVAATARLSVPPAPAAGGGPGVEGAGARIESIAIAIGAVAPTVVRVDKVEHDLAGKRISDLVPDDVARQYEPYIRPIDDQRSTARYRAATALRVIAEFVRTLQKEIQNKALEETQ